MQLTVRATPKNRAASPGQFSTLLDCNVKGAVDKKWQGHAMSSQLTRDASKSFKKLVSIASPTSKSLNLVVRNTSELLPWLPQCGSCGWKNGLQSPQRRKFAAANQSGLSETEVDHSPVRTRGQGHFLARRGKPAKPELRRGVPFPDQYGCGNPDGTDPFLTLLSKHRGRLVTGANPLRCLPLIDD